MEPGRSYHIYNHGNGSENIFRTEENYRFFLQQYTKYLGDVVDTYSYSLMPNHFHLLVGVRKDLSGFQNLTGQIKHPSKNPAIKAFTDFFNSYTKAYNLRYSRKGSLFIRSFKRLPILDDKQWRETFLYIHLNPIKHGFVKEINDWKWSSWKAYRQPEKLSGIDREYFKNFFDGIGHVEDMIEMKKEFIMNMEYEN